MRDLKLLRNDATSLNKKAAKGTTKIAAKKTTMAKADKEEMKNAIGDYSRNATKPAYFNPKVAETPIPELRGTTPESAPNLTQTPRVVVRKAPQNVVQPQAQQPQTNTQPVPQTKTQQTQVQQPKPKPQASNPNQQQQPITSMKPTVQTWAVGNPRIDGLDSAKETGMLPKFLDKVDKLNKEKK
jgi:hypothetical protein